MKIYLNMFGVEIISMILKGERLMYIDPFVAGVAATILVEIVVILVFAISGSKKKGEK